MIKAMPSNKEFKILLESLDKYITSMELKNGWYRYSIEILADDTKGNLLTKFSLTQLSNLPAYDPQEPLSKEGIKNE